MNLNKHQERRDAIMAPMILPGQGDGLRYFEGLDASTLGLLISEQFADQEETQNDSPSISDFLGFMMDNPSATAHGYIVDLPRDDYRVSIEGLNWPSGANNINAVRAFATFCNGADELDLETMRSWWD